MKIVKATDIKTDKGTYLIYGAPGKGKTTSVKFFPGKTLVLDIDRTSRLYISTTKIPGKTGERQLLIYQKTMLVNMTISW